MNMTLFERAVCLFSTEKSDTDDLEFLSADDIAKSISSASNNFNKAAILLAINHEQNPGKQPKSRYKIKNNSKYSARSSSMTMPEWNALALTLLKKDRE